MFPVRLQSLRAISVAALNAMCSSPFGQCVGAVEVDLERDRSGHTAYD
jgi:hypothetical protein